MRENQLQIVQVKNPFLRKDRDIIVAEYRDETLEQVCAKYLHDEIDVVIYVNGCPIDKQFWNTCKPRPGDQIVIMPVIADGDDKGFLGALAMIAIIIAAPYMAGYIATGIPGMVPLTGWAVTLQYGIMLAGGILVNSLMAPPQPKFDLDSQISQAYGWNPHTVQLQGIALPRWYGKNKIYGNVIAVHTEPDDSDDTKQLIKVLIAFCEGPVNGITANSIKINGQSATNYDSVTTEEKKGTLDQSAVSFFTETKPEYRPNFVVTNTGGAETYTTPDNDFDDLEIEFLFDRGIHYMNKKGHLRSHSIGIKIEISEHDAGSWNTLVAENITDNETAPIRKSYTASGSYTGGSPVTINNGTRYDIRVTKTSSDQSSVRYGDSMRLAAVREVLNDDFRYPGVAILGISALATDQLYGSLDVSCELEGRVVRTYNGSSWTIEYSNNPAWVLWDILTQPVISGDGGAVAYAVERYEGLDPSRLDVDKFYELAQFCDEMVSDGEGGTEKRITFNGGFDIGTTVWEAALKVCEIARCVLVWDGVELTLAIDKTASPVQMFSVGNIIKDSFRRTWLPQVERASEIEVHYKDELQDYKRTPMTIFDTNIDNPSNKVTLELFGITKQSEAWRAAYLRLAANRLLKASIEFQADIDAIASMIGDVIYMQHDVPDWQEGGRVVSATSSSITVDKEVTPSGGTDKVLVRVYNPGTEAEEIEDKTVASVSGKTINISGTWSVTPSKGDVFIFGSSTGYKKQYRITGLETNSDQQTTIRAIQYDADVYYGDTQGPIIPISDYHSPASDDDNTRTPTLEQIRQEYPKEILGLPSVDVPLTNNLQWNDNTPSAGYVSWSAADGDYALLFVWKGETYEITADNSNLKFIYWDENYTTSFQASNNLADAIGSGKWLMCVNESGTANPVFARKAIHGGVIQAGTITADGAQIANLTVGTAQIIDLNVTTAKIANLNITTGKIADESVTVPSSAQTTDYINVSSASPNYTTVESLAVTTNGDPLFIHASAIVLSDGGGGDASFRIYRDTTLVADLDDLSVSPDFPFSFSVKDSPGADSYTYYLKAAYKTGTFTRIAQRNICIVELKK